MDDPPESGERSEEEIDSRETVCKRRGDENVQEVGEKQGAEWGNPAKTNRPSRKPASAAVSKAFPSSKNSLVDFSPWGNFRVTHHQNTTRQTCFILSVHFVEKGDYLNK